MVKPPTLTNRRVILRAITPSDLDAIIEISVYEGVFAETKEDARAILARIDEDQADGNSLHWGICVPGRDEVLGTIGYYRGFVDAVGEVGYVMRPAYRGLGLMTAALRSVVAFGFGQLRLAAIVAHTGPSNEASIALLRRAGFAAVAATPTRLTFRLEREAHTPVDEPEVERSDDEQPAPRVNRLSKRALVV